MEIGKVPNELLKEIILNKIKHKRKEVLLRPKIGEDCCALDFGEYACVLTSDPITGAVNEIGRLAVHISCNDVASCGVEPLGLLVTILVPPKAEKSELEMLMKQICETADSLNVDIVGGHTEVTNAVNRFVVTTTAVGRILTDKLVKTSGAQPGDSIIVTKSAGIEGTAIIAADKQVELEKYFDQEFINKAKTFTDKISVIKEGIIAGNFGANSMHDVTEGGVLGALWEVAEASEVGFRVYKDRIPVEPETIKICEIYKIDPLKLISSGCMLITCKEGEKLVAELSRNGIKATVIGEVTVAKDKLVVDGEKVTKVSQPDSDELYKII